MTDTAWFWTLFPITVALLIGAVGSGGTGRRRLHLLLAPLALVMLGLTIWMAVRMGRSRVFPDQMRIHMVIADIAAVLVLPVIISGIALARTDRWRRVHRTCVIAFLLVTLIATGTGIWVFALSTPG